MKSISILKCSSNCVGYRQAMVSYRLDELAAFVINADRAKADLRIGGSNQRSVKRGVLLER
jgi:hypothetical protein